MTTPPENSDKTFPPADIDGELNPATNKLVQVDPISSEMAASKETKEQEAKQAKMERERKEAMHTLKSAIIVSCIVVAVAGAVFAITKKLREK